MYIEFIRHFLNKIGQKGWKEAVLFALDNYTKEGQLQVINQVMVKLIGDLVMNTY